MNEIKELIQTQDEFLMIILFAVFAMLVITFAVHHFTEKLRFPKYFPGVISLVVGLLMLAGLLSNLFQKEYLGDIVFSMVLIGAGVIGFAFALIIGVVFKPRKSSQKYKELEYEDY